MAKYNGFRTCKICDSKLQKNGKLAQDKQQWRCIKCSTSKIDKRTDLTKQHELHKFVNWLLDKKTLVQNTVQNRSSFYKQISWCWSINPIIIPPKRPSKFIMVDSTYVGRNNC